MNKIGIFQLIILTNNGISKFKSNVINIWYFFVKLTKFGHTVKKTCIDKLNKLQFYAVLEIFLSALISVITLVLGCCCVLLDMITSDSHLQHIKCLNIHIAYLNRNINGQMSSKFKYFSSLDGIEYLY